MYKGKKGYFFVIDAFIGSAIIFVSLAIILSLGVKMTPLHYDYSLAESYASFIIDTRIEDLNNPYVNNLVINRIITDTKNSVMDQVTRFYFNAYYLCQPADSICRSKNLTYAHEMVQNITDPLFNEKYGFNYVIRDYRLGLNHSIYNKSIDKFNTSNIIVVSKKITFLQINETRMYGPEIVDIIVWI